MIRESITVTWTRKETGPWSATCTHKLRSGPATLRQHVGLTKPLVGFFRMLEGFFSDTESTKAFLAREHEILQATAQKKGGAA